MLPFILTWFTLGAVWTILILNPFAKGGKNLSDHRSYRARHLLTRRRREAADASDCHGVGGRNSCDDIRPASLLIFPHVERGNL